MLPNIALMGYAGAGKDTVAEYLVSRYQYIRIAFADPLKEMALRVDPVIDATGDDYGRELIKLSEEVSAFGWEHVKRNFPEVRRFLRALGATMRERDADYWVDLARRKLISADSLNMPVVVTDVRHENEYLSLRDDWQFTMVRIDRPGHDTSDVDPESRRLLESVTPDATIINQWDIETLHSQVSDIIESHTS